MVSRDPGLNAINATSEERQYYAQYMAIGFGGGVLFTGGVFAISRNPNGALKGASIDITAQMGVGIVKGQTIRESFLSLDIADIFLSSVEGSITDGLTSNYKTLLNVGSEMTQAAVDIEIGGKVDALGLPGSEKSVSQVLSDGTIGVFAGFAGGAVEGTIDFATNNKMRKELPGLKVWSRRYMEGSTKKAEKFQEINALNRMILGNQRAAQVYGKLTEESSKEAVIK